MGSNSRHELKNTLTEKCAQQVVALQKAIIFLDWDVFGTSDCVFSLLQLRFFLFPEERRGK